jgi:hypothetical protein
MKENKVIEDGIEYIVHVYSSGEKTWRNGKYQLHRKIGPARIYCDGKIKEYRLNGKRYFGIKSDEHWIEFQKELIIKEIIE